MITSYTPNGWQELQTEVGRILKECGFTVEIEKKVKTVRGQVELDVFAEEEVNGRKYTTVCQCKLWKSRIPQNEVHAFRTVVDDMGANIGYIISSIGFQKGAFQAKEHTNIKLFTWQQFQDVFENGWLEIFFYPQIYKQLEPLIIYTEPLPPRWLKKLNVEQRKRFMNLKEQYDELGFFVLTLAPHSREIIDNLPLTLPIIDNFSKDSSILTKWPSSILEETAYREFLEALVAFGGNAIKQFQELHNEIT